MSLPCSKVPQFSSASRCQYYAFIDCLQSSVRSLWDEEGTECFLSWQTLYPILLQYRNCPLFVQYMATWTWSVLSFQVFRVCVDLVRGMYLAYTDGIFHFDSMSSLQQDVWDTAVGGQSSRLDSWTSGWSGFAPPGACGPPRVFPCRHAYKTELNWPPSR